MKTILKAISDRELLEEFLLKGRLLPEHKKAVIDEINRRRDARVARKNEA